MKENTAAVHAQVPVDVATYLLNEKRSEFHAIESRMKVNVVLVPNIHLETPNYTLTRLRHDELNQMEPLPASYQLMEQPAEAEKPTLPSAEAKAPRPQAAVQGITPAQPAPLPATVPSVAPSKPSILQKIFGWLRANPETPQEPVKVKPRAPQHEALRRERDRRHGGGRGDSALGQRRGQEAGRGQRPRESDSEGRMQNKPAPEKGAGRTFDTVRPRADGESRNRGQERPDRPARSERHDRPARPEGTNEQHAEGGRGRRRRGRRDRGPGPERAIPGQQQMPAIEAVLVDVPAAPVQEHAIEAAPVRVTPPREVSAEVVSEAPHETEPLHHEMAPVHIEPAHHVPQVDISRAAATIPSFELPPDLIQVETAPGKAGQRMEAEPAQSGERPRRPRAPEEPISSEPLVQIETRH